MRIRGDGDHGLGEQSKPSNACGPRQGSFILFSPGQASLFLFASSAARIYHIEASVVNRMLPGDHAEPDPQFFDNGLQDRCIRLRNLAQLLRRQTSGVLLKICPAAWLGAFDPGPSAQEDRPSCVCLHHFPSFSNYGLFHCS